VSARPTVSSLPAYNEVDPQQHQEIDDGRSDPLGLRVLYTPTTAPSIDIIFVHGVGGTSRRSWSKDGDPARFWPREWLPLEPEIDKTRILSFGYNAYFKGPAPGNTLNISDFANELLYSMKYSVDENKSELGLGRVPIILVAHSMGGLVVKKAITSGQIDAHYKDIVKQVRAIVFLSTPHRGSDLADALNRILAASVFGHSPKQYIAELQKRHPTLFEINEQFRKIAPSIRIASFFETQPTFIGLKKSIIVPRASAVLGYPEEISKAMDADHHCVIKFTNQNDPNYVCLRNLLMSFVLEFRQNPDEIPRLDINREEAIKIKTVLGDLGAPNDDLDFFWRRSMRDTGNWILKHPAFKRWLLVDSTQPQVLWLNGLPGTGKSVLSSAIIHHFIEEGSDCSYFYFRFGERNKRLLSPYLRSMASQIAPFLPHFRGHLLKLAEEGLCLEKADGRQVWQKIFVPGFSKATLPRSLYWIIDAVDEADAPKSVLEIIENLCDLQIPLRILYTSRRGHLISNFHARLARKHSCETIVVDGNDEDLRTYVQRGLQDLRGDSSFRQRVIDQVLIKAGSNFLWAHLVTQEILLCHTEPDIEEVLDQLPAELEPLYKRMDAALVNSLRTHEKRLAKSILTWASCSKRPLHISELEIALQSDHPPLIDPRATIGQVCGDFVVVDSLDRLMMVHHTAREYITKDASQDLHVEPSEGHRTIFERCLSCLSHPDARLHADLVESHPFILYAAVSWPYHLNEMPAHTEQNTLLQLTKFFHNSMVLTWIQILAAQDVPSILIEAAKALNLYLERQSRVDSAASPFAHRVLEKEFLAKWAVDLVKIVGKFGTHLTKYPRSIHKLVVPFCPRESAIYQEHAPKARGALSVAGSYSDGWDDCLAKFSVGKDCQASSITCVGAYFVVSVSTVSTGSVVFFDSSTFQQVRELDSGERILAMRFSGSGDKLITCGYRRTIVWDVPSACEISVHDNPKGMKPIACALSADETKAFAFGDDRSVRAVKLNDATSEWRIVDYLVIDDIVDGQYVKSPHRAAFNVDATYLAVCFRGCALLVWKVQPLKFLDRLVRPRDRKKGPGDLFTTVDRLEWNNDTGQILGLYNEGTVFTWKPLDPESQELELKKDSRATEIHASPLGNIFVTSSVHGTLRVWSFHDFSLIYQLSCTSPVVDLAISPDSRRIYDLRDTFCNVWEPNSLIRLSEMDEKASEASSASEISQQGSHISELSVEMLEPITSLTVGPQTSMFSYGNEEGVVKIFDILGNSMCNLPSTVLTVDHLLWSNDEKILVTGDVGGRICARSVDTSDMHDIKTKVIFEVSIKGPIRQILLDPTAKYLLASTPDFLTVWDLYEKKAKCSRDVHEASFRWVNHHQDEKAVLLIDEKSIKLYQWPTLELRLETNFSRPLCRDTEKMHNNEPRKPSMVVHTRMGILHDIVERTLVSRERSQILLEFSRPSSSSKGRYYKDYLLLPLSQLERHDSGSDADNGDDGCSDGQANDADNNRTSATTVVQIQASLLQGNLLHRIEQPLGFIAGETLVFLDKEFWVSSCVLNHGNNGTANCTRIKRHFFLPRDWLNAECLHLALITKEGTLLCPKNGEVAVVRNGMNDEWID